MLNFFDIAPHFQKRENSPQPPFVEFYADTPSALLQNEAGQWIAPEWKKSEKVTRDLLVDFIAKTFIRSSGNFDKFKRILEENIANGCIDRNTLLVAADMLSDAEMAYLSHCFHNFHKNITTKKIPEAREVVIPESSIKNLVRGELARAIGVVDRNGKFRQIDTSIKLRKLLKKLGVPKESLPHKITVGNLDRY